LSQPDTNAHRNLNRFNLKSAIAICNTTIATRTQVRDDASQWDEDAHVLRLQHTIEDKAKGVRAYLEAILASLFCHVDVQSSDGRGMLLRYVSSYVPKFSDSFATTWLNDEASDYAIARRVLSDYHPLEPEMWLQLGAHLFSQCFSGGTMKRFIVPVPWKNQLPQAIEAYMDATWRGDSMSCLEFLRKSNPKGEIRNHIKKAFPGAATDVDSLNIFAREYKPRGEVMIAAITLSRYNDEYYGQWMIMHVPFESVDDLWDARAAAVPKSYQFLTLCLLARPDHWRDPQNVQADLELEAYKDTHINNVQAMIKANTELIDLYLDGSLIVGVDPEPQPYCHPYASFKLEAEQMTVTRAIQHRVQRAMSSLREKMLTIRMLNILICLRDNNGNT
jgi:hypothetical protein